LAAATVHAQITYLSDARSASGHAALDLSDFAGAVSISYSGDDSQSATPSAPFADFNTSLLGGAQADVMWVYGQRRYGAGFSAAQTSSLSPLQLYYSGSASAGQDDPFSLVGVASSASQFSVSFSVSNSIPYALRCTPSGGPLGWTLSSSSQGVIISENYPPSQDYSEHDYTGTFLPDQTYTLQANINAVSGPPGANPFGSLEVVCVVWVPAVWTLSATAVTANSATLTGMVNPNGSSTTAWFQWGATTNYGNLTSLTNLGSGTTALPLSAPLAGLTLGVPYHFRVAATNDYGVAYGSDQSFTMVPTFSDADWVSLGSGMNGEVRALVMSGTILYAGGEFTTAGGVLANNIAKWNGNAWSALGSGLNYAGEVWALAVSGTSLYAGTANVFNWGGSGWADVGWTGGVNPEIRALAVSGSNLYAGGSFTSVAGAAATDIATWDGRDWSALGLGDESRDEYGGRDRHHALCLRCRRPVVDRGRPVHERYRD
jgi:hypothetical protein